VKIYRQQARTNDGYLKEEVMLIQEVYIMSGARTAIGTLGALKDFLGHQLVVYPMEEVIKRAKIGRRWWKR
jgi:hypothetical protein